MQLEEILLDRLVDVQHSIQPSLILIVESHVLSALDVSFSCLEAAMRQLYGPNLIPNRCPKRRSQECNLWRITISEYREGCM